MFGNIDKVTINGRPLSQYEKGFLLLAELGGIVYGMNFYLSNYNKIHNIIVENYTFLQEAPDIVKFGIDFGISALCTAPPTLGLVTLIFLSEVAIDNYLRQRR